MKLSRSAIVFLVLAAAAVGLAASAAEPPFAVTWQGVLSPMPKGLGWGATVAYNSRIYVFGGLSNTETENSVTLGTTQIYDPATDSWTSGAAMPTARYLATAVEVGGKIYVMGGRTIDSLGSGGPVDKNEVYNPATDSWSTVRAMPTPNRGHMAAAWGTKIYVFGGNTGSYVRTVSIYDTAGDSWSSGAQMAAARAYGAAVAVPGKTRIYLIGGASNATSTCSTCYLGNAVAYDPTRNAWDTGTIAMVSGEATSTFAACLSGTKIYVFPGQKWDSVNSKDAADSAVTQALDTATNTFAALNTVPPSPVSRVEAGAALVDGKIYLIGGSEGFRVVDAFDPASATWLQGNAPIPAFLGNANMAAVGDKLVVVNGGSSQGLNNGVYVYDPVAGSWTKTTATNPLPRTGGVHGIHNGKVILADGLDSSNDSRGEAQSYDPVANTFAALATDTAATNLAFGDVVNGKLYVFGGYNTGTKADVATGRALDLSGNVWNPTASLPLPMEAAAAAAFNGKLYIFGGYDKSPDDGLNDNVLIYDPATNAFTTGAPLAIPVYHASAAVYNGHILIYGGNTLYTQDTTLYYRPAPYLQVYDPASDTFTSTTLVYTRVDHSAAVIGDAVFATCGSDNSFLETRLDIAALGAVGPSPLKASAHANPASGPAPLAVSLSASATGGTPPYTYSWNLGDGGTSSQQNPTHTYAAGSYTATLTVHDAADGTATSTVDILSSNVAPPVVSAVKKVAPPFKIVVTGSNLQNGIKAYINGTQWSSVVWKSQTKIQLTGTGLKTAVPKGTPTHLSFVNPDGGQASYDFSW
jgi:N-acetylneuraminic acid mutarotase